MSDSTLEKKFTNKLVGENSPYLLSHAHNPVNWYPWGDEALKKAKDEDKPIFLSIGYSACHWCHVMERESFENEQIAAILNKYFISIKVDREQRPDLDQIYMTFTQAMTGHGGWPMSVFLTPDLKPFYAGTYFPPTSQYGRVGFEQLIIEIGEAYKEDKENIVASADNIFSQINDRLKVSEENSGELSEEYISNAANALMGTFDHQFGGFGHAPKFPHATELALFLCMYNKTDTKLYLESTEKALNAMADGGIYDQIGGGFARYSTDERWLVPHFEKMLYDNGLLVQTYADAYQITKNDYYKEIIHGTLDFILTELTDESGGFYSALDADSEGEEGKFYVWDKSEIDKILGDDASLFCDLFNVSEKGNFEGKNILHKTEISHKLYDTFTDVEKNKIKSSIKKLYDARAKRIRPLTDDKILTSWNGMALSAFTRGYQVTRDKKYLDAALKNASFVRSELFRSNALTHSYRKGIHSDGAFLEDYAYYLKGLLDLYELDRSDNNVQWIQFASQLASEAIELFMDDNGKLYLRPDSLNDLIMRPSDETDSAVPAAGSILLQSLVKLHRITGDADFINAFEKGINALTAKMKIYPNGMASAVLALDYFLNDKIEIVVVGDSSEKEKIFELVDASYIPNSVIAYHPNGDVDIPLFENRKVTDGELQVYVCINSVCKLPVSTADEFQIQLNEF